MQPIPPSRSIYEPWILTASVTKRKTFSLEIFIISRHTRKAEETIRRSTAADVNCIYNYNYNT